MRDRNEPSELDHDAPYNEKDGECDCELCQSEGGEMTLTPEQIDLLKRLQPFFKEKMGEWQLGDNFYSGDATAIVVNIKATGAWDKEERLYSRYYDEHNFLASDSMSYANKHFLRIPKAIDWQNPERGLWGMIDWGKQHGEIMPDGDVWIFSIPYFEHHQPKFKADPFTALLKALAEQEEV